MRFNGRNNRGGAPKGNQNRTTHGLYSGKKLLSELGTRAIDGRTTVGRALNDWRRELIRDLGGEDALSVQQHQMVELCVRERFLLDSVDGWLFRQPSVLNARKKALHPVVIQRQGLADSLRRTLKDLGLERKAAPVPKLEDYIASRDQRGKEDR